MSYTGDDFAFSCYPCLSKEICPFENKYAYLPCVWFLAAAVYSYVLVVVTVCTSTAGHAYLERVRNGPMPLFFRCICLFSIQSRQRDRWRNINLYNQLYNVYKLVQFNLACTVRTCIRDRLPARGHKISYDFRNAQITNNFFLHFE